MKKYIKLTLVAAAIVGLISLMRYHPSAQTDTASNVQLQASGSSPTKLTPQSASIAYKDGTFNGDSVDVGYGIVQVAAIISGDKITDVQYLQMPNDRQHSVEVTNYAEPILKSETLQAQSSNVDIASGATSTSEGFMQSLQAALDKAKA